MSDFPQPKVLGSYDVSPEEGWMVLKDQFGDDFFYNPLEWNISFEQPVGTYLCDKCKKDFCVARVEIDDDKPAYCEACFNEFALATFSTGIDKEKLLLKPFKGGWALVSIAILILKHHLYALLIHALT